MYNAIIFADYFGLYINSQQEPIGAVYTRWNSTAISHIGPNLPYLNSISDVPTMRKQPHVKVVNVPTD